MAAMEPANDSGMPLISPFAVTYVAPQFYEISMLADKIVWTFAITLAVALRDWLSSLPAEYDRIWRREKTFVTFLYIGSRYYSLAVMTWLLWMYLPAVHTWSYCQRWYRWSCGLTVPIEMFAGAILLVRTWAFSGRKLYYLLLFVALYLTMIIYMLVVTAKALELVPWFEVGQTRGRCVTAGFSGNQLATGFWVAPLGFTIILTGVTLFESIKIRQRMPASKRSPLFRVFIRDGVMYLAVITATNTANVAFFAQGDASLKGAATAFQFLFASLMSCRLVLSLRDSESLAMQSAAASLATKSFWRTGMTPMDSGNSTVNRRNVMSDEERNESFAMKAQEWEQSTRGDASPKYSIPGAVHVKTDQFVLTSEASEKEEAALRF
ncbi:hypothetical protein P389DRAFT_210424 [Cystobasidium minutum MCA 4210]|uniref:uncharacterized protein n=1 Tax=Cystobasidium minutum MCA 4210 TaxID=1397322 RepID=UPI0034CDD434|eukprot:jgi/Rhomi1/210424/estExt_Genemark1.C_3_t30192